jgi:hypothetical protein
MKPRRLSGVAAAALAVAGPLMAHAADLWTLKEPPSQAAFFGPPFTWTGFYLGLNAGGVLGTGSRTTTLYDTGFPLTPSGLTRADGWAAARRATIGSSAGRCSVLRRTLTGRA